MKSAAYSLALAFLCVGPALAGQPVSSSRLPEIECSSRELLQFNSGYTVPAFVVRIATSREFAPEKVVHILSGSPSVQHRVSVEQTDDGALEVTSLQSGLSPRFMAPSAGMWLSLGVHAEALTTATLTLSHRELEKLQEVTIAHVGWEKLVLINGRLSVELSCTVASK
jgi:hypothetical protein